MSEFYDAHAAAAAATVATDEHMQSAANHIAAMVPDTRDDLRRLHTINSVNATYIEEYEPETVDLDHMRITAMFKDLYGTTDAPTPTSTEELRDCMQQIEQRHGCSDLHKRLLEIIMAYTEAYSKLCKTHARCRNALRDATQLRSALCHVPYIDVLGQEYAALQTATAAYLKHVREDVLDVSGAFAAFQTAYLEWMTLRSVILTLHPFARGAPHAPGACTICTSAPVDHAYIPCGHTFCRTCAHKHSGMCYVCRSPIEKVQQLFFL